MISFDEFIACLQGCGWKDSGDAQHEVVKVFYECLRDASKHAVLLQDIQALRRFRPEIEYEKGGWKSAEMKEYKYGSYLMLEQVEKLFNAA